jgi:hypothetical protein
VYASKRGGEGMNKKIIVFMAAGVLIISATWFLVAQSGEDLVGPPGLMADELWIPLSENSGFALSISASTASATRGTLMIKLGEDWKRVYLDPGPAQFKEVK